MLHIDDRIILPGLFLVALSAWGENCFGTQAFMLQVVALLAISFMSGDIIVVTLGAYLSIWYVYLYVFANLDMLYWEVMVQASDSIVLMMSGFVLYSTVRYGKMPVSWYMNGGAVLGTVLSLIGLIHYSVAGKAVATLGNQNFLAVFLVLSALCCYRRKWWVLLVPIISCLILTRTSMAMAALMVGTGFYFFRWVGAGAALVPSIGYFFLFKEPASLLIRIDYWMDALRKISHSWETVVFGVGPGIYWQWGNTLHSEPIYLLWNLGMIGVLLAVLYIFRSCREINNNRIVFAMFLAVLVDSFGNHLMHTAPTAMLAGIVFGLKDRLRIPFGSQK